MPEPQHERKFLNDHIENAYVQANKHVADIRTYYETKLGTVKESFELFYYNFALLVEFTEYLQKMEKEEPLFEEIHNWLDNKDKEETEQRCRSGIVLFGKLKKSLNTKGVIALPTK